MLLVQVGKGPEGGCGGSSPIYDNLYYCEITQNGYFGDKEAGVEFLTTRWAP